MVMPPMGVRLRNRATGIHEAETAPIKPGGSLELLPYCLEQRDELQADLTQKHFKYAVVQLWNMCKL